MLYREIARLNRDTAGSALEASDASFATRRGGHVRDLIGSSVCHCDVAHERHRTGERSRDVERRLAELLGRDHAAEDKPRFLIPENGKVQPRAGAERPFNRFGQSAHVAPPGDDRAATTLARQGAADRISRPPAR